MYVFMSYTNAIYGKKMFTARQCMIQELIACS